MRALTRRTTSAAIAGALVLTGAAACGSSKKSSSDGGTTTSSKTKDDAKKDPQAAFTAALTKLGATKDAKLTFKFSGTEAEITAFAKASSDSFDANDAKLAHYLATGDITVTTKDGAGEFDVNLDGKPVVQVIGSKAGVYLRAAVSQLAALGGDSATASVNQVAAAVPTQFAFVKDAIAGKWLSIDAAALKQIESLAASQTGGSVPSVDPSQAKALEAKLATALGADFTATDAGSDPKGEHLVLKGNSKKLVADFLDVAKSVPGASAALTKIDTTQVPDKDITLDAFVGDAGLSTLQLNLAQFADKPAAQALSFPIEIDFASNSTAIQTPTDVTKVDISSLLAGLGGLSSSLGNG